MVPMVHSAVLTTLCRARWSPQDDWLPYQTDMAPVSMLYNSRVEGNQDLLGDLESAELSKVIKALSCLFHHSVRVYSP